MAGDDLLQLLAVARQAAPEIPPAVWLRVEAAIRQSDLRAQRLYIAARSKRRNLQAVESAPPEESTDALACRLGLSPRRIRQLRQLARGG